MHASKAIGHFLQTVFFFDWLILLPLIAILQLPKTTSLRAIPPSMAPKTAMKSIKTMKSMKDIKVMNAMKASKAMNATKAAPTPSTTTKAMKTKEDQSKKYAMLPKTVQHVPPLPFMAIQCTQQGCPSWVWIWKLQSMSHCAMCGQCWCKSIDGQNIHWRM